MSSEHKEISAFYRPEKSAGCHIILYKLDHYAVGNFVLCLTYYNWPWQGEKFFYSQFLCNVCMYHGNEVVRSSVKNV